MGISARVPSGAVTYYFVPTIYSNKVIDVEKKNLVAFDAVDSSWETQLRLGYILNIPVLNVVTATEVTVGTKAASLNPFATAGKQLTIDKWYEAPIDIDTMTSHQTQVAMEAEAKDTAAYAIQVRIDTTVCTLFSTLGGTTYPNSDGDALTDDVLLELTETLNENDVPMDSNRSLILDPSGLTDMLKIDKFVAAQYVNIGAVNNGIIGKSPIYGCTVRVTNNLVAVSGGTGAYGVMLHKKAIGAAAQIQNAWMKDFPELHNVRYSVDALWGVIELRDAWGKAFYTRKA